MPQRLKQITHSKFTLFALLLTFAVGFGGSSSSMLTGHPIEFDLDTDNYVGTFNFQVRILDSPYDVINTEWVKFSSVISRTVEDKKGKLRTEYEPITASRVYKGVDALYGWRRDVENGILNKYDIEIIMMNSGFQAVRSFYLVNAWPSAWQTPPMVAESSEPALELIEFQSDGVFETVPD